MKRYKSIYKESKYESSVEYWSNFLNEAPSSVIKDAIIMIRNRKFLWNSKLIKLGKDDINSITNLQIALDNYGDRKYNVMMRDMNAARIDTGT